MRLSSRILLLGLGMLLLAGHTLTYVGGALPDAFVVAGEISMFLWPIAIIAGAVLRLKGK